MPPPNPPASSRPSRLAIKKEALCHHHACCNGRLCRSCCLQMGGAAPKSCHRHVCSRRREHPHCSTLTGAEPLHMFTQNRVLAWNFCTFVFKIELWSVCVFTWALVRSVLTSLLKIELWHGKSSRYPSKSSPGMERSHICTRILALAWSVIFSKSNLASKVLAFLLKAGPWHGTPSQLKDKNEKLPQIIPDPRPYL